MFWVNWRFRRTCSSSCVTSLIEIYPDEELDEWKKHLSEFPNEWINGYDKKFTIKEEQVYDLKAIPTLYLLDKDKTVLLKDATAPAIEAYLMQHQ